MSDKAAVFWFAIIGITILIISGAILFFTDSFLKAGTLPDKICIELPQSGK